MLAVLILESAGAAAQDPGALWVASEPRGPIPRSSGAEDCNGNGIPDALDISSGTSTDCDGNGVPDECDVAVVFVSHSVTNLANGPQNVFAADLDGDGDLDLLTASFDDDKVAWHKNLDGNGTFGAQQIITQLANGAVAVFAADLDGDGDLDALSASALDDKIAWYRNNGTGTFGGQKIISNLAAGAWSVFAADLDGDGDLDALSASQEDNKLAWYANNGVGSFGAQRVVSMQVDKPLSVIGADLDGDGDADIASASFGDDRISWYENADGSGTFGARQVVSGDAAGASKVEVADLDGDGDLDLVSASTFDNKIAWYEKLDGVDSFGPERIVSSGAQQALYVSAGDLDADGDLDLVSASFGSSTIAWHENTDGAGTFGPPRSVTATAFGATSVIAADLDGDGDADLVHTSQNDDSVRWQENQGNDCNGNGIPDACEPDCNANGRADACDLAAGASADCNANSAPDECDIAGGVSQDCAGEGLPDECEPDCNGNGLADTCDIDSGISQDCTGDGVPDECEPDCNGNGLADTCDIDSGISQDCTGDGVPDECEPDCNGNGESDGCDMLQGGSADCNENGVPDECDATSLDCNANGVPDECDTGLEFTEHVISTAANFTRSVFAADLDGDGDADALSASGLDDKIAWYENLDGAGTFGRQRIISTGTDLALSVLAADLDGDRDTDVMSASFGDNKIAWHEQTFVPGEFGPQQVISASAIGALSLFAADLDGDGDLDALSASFLDDKIAWYENVDGQGTFGAERVISSGAAGAFCVSAANLDSDSDLDVLRASFDDDKIAWHENDGSGVFGPRRIVSATADGATAVVAADIDGDGDADLISASQNDDKIAWYENLDGDGNFGPERLVSTQANGATSVFAEDVDGDGDVDLLSASFFDNRIAWYENLDGAGTFGLQRIVSVQARGAYSVVATDVDGDGDIDILSASQDDDKIAWYENESGDCNGNSIPDSCDIAGRPGADCSGNGVLDECEADCNGNGLADSCDILSAASDDCNLNGFPDECEPDCDGNGAPDGCDIANGAPDCNLNGVLDPCEPDCNGNARPDDCDIASGASDCNANGLPDECEADCNDDGVPNACDPDCNGNGVPDGCDIDPGTSIDCNGNGVPDECDVPCPTACDADGDRCRDALDSAPGNRHVCSDVEPDSCDDCSSGHWDPAFDGPDDDADGFCAVGDCDDDDAGVWSDPGPAHSLRLASGLGATLLTWQPPAQPGAAAVFYDTLRSGVASDFHDLTFCLYSDQLLADGQDAAVPGNGGVFHYLIRVENGCPGGSGAMGADSAGNPRSGRPCP